jgi:hypothetical protein
LAADSLEALEDLLGRLTACRSYCGAMRLRPSPPTVIALLALFVALGGPAQAARLIGSKDIKRSAVNSKHVKNRSLATSDLRLSALTFLRATPPNSVTTAELAAGAVRVGDLGEGAVTAGKIAEGAVGTAAIANNTIGSVDIAPNSVQSDEISNGTVSGLDIGEGQVGTSEVSDGALTVRDVGSFAGTFNTDFGPLNPDQCTTSTHTLTAVRGATTANLSDDVVLATPVGNWNGSALEYSVNVESPTTIRLLICNEGGAEPVQGSGVTFRYVTFDA